VELVGADHVNETLWVAAAPVPDNDTVLTPPEEALLLMVKVPV